MSEFWQRLKCGFGFHQYILRGHANYGDIVQCSKCGDISYRVLR